MDKLSIQVTLDPPLRTPLSGTCLLKEQCRKPLFGVCLDPSPERARNPVRVGRQEGRLGDERGGGGSGGGDGWRGLGREGTAEYNSISLIPSPVFLLAHCSAYTCTLTFCSAAVSRSPWRDARTTPRCKQNTPPVPLSRLISLGRAPYKHRVALTWPSRSVSTFNLSHPSTWQTGVISIIGYLWRPISCREPRALTKT